jgi:hypothetical protein
MYEFYFKFLYYGGLDVHMQQNRNGKTCAKGYIVISANAVES